MTKDTGVLNIKTEKTDSIPSEQVQIKTEVKKEENVIIKNEQVTQEVKTESIIKQNDTKTENEDEQNVKVDVTSSPTGYVNIIS